jgi:hypothetical protein
MSRLFKRVRQIPSGAILPLHEVRHRAVTDAIDKCGGNYMLAAKMLGIGRTTIYRWVHTHGYGCPKDQAAALQAATLGMRSESRSPVHDHRMD